MNSNPSTSVRHTGLPIGRRGRAALVGTIAIIVAGFGLAGWLTPDPQGFGTHQQLGFPPCSAIVLFGLPCPSCGSTTAFAWFVRGAWIQSATANPAAFLLALICLVTIPWSLWSVWQGCLWRITDPACTLALILIGLATLALLQWGVRCMMIRYP